VQCEPRAGSVRLAALAFDPTKLKAQTYGADPAVVVFEGSVFCSASVMAPMSIDVTRAEGGTAPYPMLLTPDYVRALTIHADTGPLDPAIVHGCPLASVRVDLQLIETASDLIQDPTGSCTFLGSEEPTTAALDRGRDLATARPGRHRKVTEASCPARFGPGMVPARTRPWGAAIAWFLLGDDRRETT
jgi:hypothetical protein